MQVKKYKNISFDFWLTLFKSNPEFKTQRDLFMYMVFQPTISLEEFKKVCRKVDVISSEKCETSGLHISSLSMIKEIGIQSKAVRGLDYRSLQNIQYFIQELALSLPPVPYDIDTIAVIKELSKKYVLNILSNTGLVSGVTLNKILGFNDIFEEFSFMIYSDQIGIAKPNELIFKYISNTPHEVLHVGDNPIADGGCKKYNIDFFQINSGNNSIKDLLTFLL